MFQDRANVISSPVRVLLALLIIFGLTISNGAGRAAALCQHADARAHAAALNSSDASMAAAASSEDSAAAAVGKDGALATAAAVSVASFILPADPIRFPTQLAGATEPFVRDAARLSGRSSPPLLEPPLV